MTAGKNGGSAAEADAETTSDLRVSALLFAPQSCSLLVTRNNEDGERYLPRFAYPQQPVTSHLCCRDVHLLLEPSLDHVSPPHDTAFEVVAELFPTFLENTSFMYNPGISRVTLLNATDESALTHLPLPKGVEWMSVSDFCYQLENNGPYDFEYLYERSILWFLLVPCTEPSLAGAGPYCWHSRILQGWKWLTRELESRRASVKGSMRRDPASPFAYLMVLCTSDGELYLKFPIRGCNESRKTSVISRLFPCDTPDVVAANEDIDCFAASPLQMITCVTDRDKAAALGKLAQIQRRAEQHVRALEEAGLWNRRPSFLMRQVACCVQHPLFIAAVEKKKLCSSNVERFLTAACERLAVSQIPVTLVHGDFRMDNVARRKRTSQASVDTGKKNGVIIFDWQYACISHPFCDLTDCSIVSNSNLVRDYLRLWEESFGGEEVRQDMEDAKIVGRLLRFFTFVELEKRGHRQGQVPFEFTMTWWAKDLLTLVEGAMKDDSRIPQSVQTERHYEFDGNTHRFNY